MNLFEKVQNIKLDIMQADLKKSGENKFAKYSYYELQDFIPAIIQSCIKHKVLTSFSFDADLAILYIYDAEKPDTKPLVYTSPMSSANLKGCHPVQNIGAVETYQRRYLYMAAFDIIESDGLDHEIQNTNQSNQKNNNYQQRQQQNPNQKISPQIKEKMKELNEVQSKIKNADKDDMARYQDLMKNVTVVGINNFIDYLKEKYVDIFSPFTQDNDDPPNWVNQ